MWLFTELYGSEPERDIGVGLTEMQLDPVGIRLLGALARAVGPDAGTPADRARGVRRAAELARQALSELHRTPWSGPTSPSSTRICCW
ncbi:hypothetical protein [Streptomyces javensis]|uniref:Uncharacterized protein n=1 Tax=Streptomyces javensis TaxID=114698 RepID=A0ABS0RAJ5_9ACTN|nr:hypothetical protein [Streptomyces javensis]MBI0314110.1 hypothetical protein [Streptomyces javensis]